MAVERENVETLMRWLADAGPARSAHAGAGIVVEPLSEVAFDGERQWPDRADQVDAYRQALSGWFNGDAAREGQFAALTSPDADPGAFIDWFLPVVLEWRDRSARYEAVDVQQDEGATGWPNRNHDGTPGTEYYLVDAAGEYLYSASADGPDWASYEQHRYGEPAFHDQYGLICRYDRRDGVYEWRDQADGSWNDQAWADRYAAGRPEKGAARYINVTEYIPGQWWTGWDTRECVYKYVRSAGPPDDRTPAGAWCTTPPSPPVFTGVEELEGRDGWWRGFDTREDCWKLVEVAGPDAPDGLPPLPLGRKKPRSDVEAAMRVVFVHGACVRDGSWWWHRTAELLRERGVPSVAPALPSCGEAGLPGGAGGPGLPEDVAAVRRSLLDSDEPTVVVAHSYGGIVTAEAAAGVGSVRHLLLVSSYLPDVGQSLSDFGDGSPAPFLVIDPEAGTFGVRPELLAGTFLQDCDPEIQAQAADHLARQSVQVTGQPVEAAAWKQVPSTYLVCAQDRGTPPSLQREFARRAGSVVELDAGHHPFLSQPAAVRDLLLSL